MFYIFDRFYCIYIGYHGPTAYKVMTESTSMIKEAQIGLDYLADKMLEERIINDNEKRDIMDGMTGQTMEQRMDKLISTLKTTIKTDGNVFQWFIDILEEKNTLSATKLAETLIAKYSAK